MPAYRWAWYIEGVDPEVGNSFLDDHSEAGLAERVVARSAPPTRVIAWGRGGRDAGAGASAAFCAGRLPLSVPSAPRSEG